MFICQALVISALLGQTHDTEPEVITSPFIDGITLSVRPDTTRASVPKLSPKYGWKFDLGTLVALDDGKAAQSRFRIFAQSPSSHLVTGTRTARLLGRLYDFNMTVLRLDHWPRFNDKQVDVYLCNEGAAGGEQMFGQDLLPPDSNEVPAKVSAIFIFDVDTLDDPLEAVRELAHEYGHATLPPVQVPKGREQWANGHLGERLYLTWLRGQFKKGTLKPTDAFGVQADGLERYYKAKVRPLIAQFLVTGPVVKQLSTKDDKGFEAYLALTLYAYHLLPAETFRRSLVLTRDDTPAGYLRAITDAVNERHETPLKVPLSGITEYWVPIGIGKVSAGKVVARSGSWVKVRSSGPVSIISPETD